MELTIKILPDDESKWYPSECERCGWIGSSENLDGGHAIADTGDFSDPLCPVCGSKDVDEAENIQSLIGLAERLSKAQNVIRAVSEDNQKLQDDLWQKHLGTKKIVCYCGSLRVALEAFKKAEYESVLNGEIALLPCCMFVDIEREYGADSGYKIQADDVHKRKIDICDEVMVLNVGGYIGESTRSEIDYATIIGKPIKYLEALNKPKE